MFKSIGGFFRDIVAPIGIGLAFGPGAAAVYSGINTGITIIFNIIYNI